MATNEYDITAKFDETTVTIAKAGMAIVNDKAATSKEITGKLPTVDNPDNVIGLLQQDSIIGGNYSRIRAMGKSVGLSDGSGTIAVGDKIVASTGGRLRTAAGGERNIIGLALTNAAATMNAQFNILIVPQWYNS